MMPWLYFQGQEDVNVEKRCWKPGVEVFDSSLLHGEGDDAHYNEVVFSDFGHKQNTSLFLREGGR